jgi:hypothetical protein
VCASRATKNSNEIQAIHLEGEKRMFRFRPTYLFVLLAALTASAFAIPQQDDPSVKQDMKDAGHSTKQAAQDTGHATKKTAKKSGHAVKKDTKNAANKTAKKTDQGAQKVEDKTQPNQ